MSKAKKYVVLTKSRLIYEGKLSSIILIFGIRHEVAVVGGATTVVSMSARAHLAEARLPLTPKRECRSLAAASTSA